MSPFKQTNNEPQQGQNWSTEVCHHVRSEVLGTRVSECVPTGCHLHVVPTRYLLLITICFDRIILVDGLLYVIERISRLLPFVVV